MKMNDTTPDLMKTCSKCGASKHIGEFSKDKNRNDGLYPQCKECKNKYYEGNKKKIQEQRTEYYKEHREEIIKKHKIYYQINRESIAKRTKKYYNNNKEIISTQIKEYRGINKDKIAKKKSEYYHNDKINILLKRNEQGRPPKTAVFEVWKVFCTLNKINNTHTQVSFGKHLVRAGKKLGYNITSGRSNADRSWEGIDVTYPYDVVNPKISIL